KNIRLLRTPARARRRVEFRQICGGLLVQEGDLYQAPGDEPSAWQLAAGPAASAEVLADLAFAWRAVRAVKSNAILLAHGQEVLIDAGVRAVVQPGGSVRDADSVAAAEAAGVSMYLTGTRHFAH